MSSEVERGRAATESDRLHAQVQRVLGVGLAVAVVLMGVGLALTIAAGAEDALPLRPTELLGAGVPPGLRLTALGILVLALTPAFRVLFLIFAWWRERDYRFIAVALAVLVTLGASLLSGRGG